MARRNIADEIRKRVNDAYSDQFGRAFLNRFGVTLTTTFNLFTMSLVSSRDDGGELTEEMKAWSEAFSAGYYASMSQIPA